MSPGVRGRPEAGPFTVHRSRSPSLTLSRPPAVGAGIHRPGAGAMPTPLPQIDSRTWEHPADRAALNTLRAIPGFDEVVRKVAGFFGERGIRQLFLGDAVKVTAGQRPNMNVMWTE